MKRHPKLLILLVTVLLLVGTAFLLWKTDFFNSLTSFAAIRDYIDRAAPYSHLTFFFIQLLSVIIAPIPSNITASAGAMLFGTWPAFLLTAAAITVGSMLVFGLARLLGRDFADKMVSAKISARYLDVVRRKRDTFLFLAFLFPLFPDDLLCILAGLTDIPTVRFLLLCLIARPWGLLFACALGGSAFSIPLWILIPLGIVGLIFFLLCLKYGDKWEAALLERFRK